MPVWPEIPNNEFKSFVYEQFSRIGKAFSTPARLIILNILCQGEHTVETLAGYAGLTVANLSRHLQVLKAANLVKMRRDGKFIYYMVADETTCRFFSDFKDFAYNQLVEIRTALQEISKAPSRLHPVDREELMKRLNEEDTLIIDVRPEDEHQQGHLPGAVSIPLEELERRLSELPEDKGIVAYCRGRYCILADKAVDLLLAKGYRAQRADDGVVEWKIDGLPVEKP
jgi:rhodanese-related sulfurtransferase